MKKDLYGIGEAPPLGFVPPRMHAYLVRPERFGEPKKSFQLEVVDTPEIGDDEVLVYVMAAGVNYNNVWAALGVPVDVISARQKAGEREPFHVGGSDGSGIVYKVGKKVKRLAVGDEVVIHCGTWDSACPTVQAGTDPMYSPTFRIWGYETNWGSFAQFTRVQEHQCLPRPKHLTWEASAAYMLVGATAYRMLLGWAPNVVKREDVVLVWGGAGGLGSIALQIAKARGAVPVAVISSLDKAEYCKSLGAKGVINRNDFDHWGMLPHWKDSVGYATWLKGVRRFGKAIWDVVGDRRNPQLVFEHPGESTIPTSIFVCETGGLVVICAGTTGYNATVDLRYLWMRQKRLQGSHFANDEQAQGLNDLVLERHVDPCLSQSFTFDELPQCHQLMYENKHPYGNMAILVGAAQRGTGISEKLAGTAIAMAPRREASPLPAFGARAALATAGGGDLEGEPESFPEGVADDTPISAIMRPHVVTCPPDASALDVLRLLVKHRIHGVVVVDAAGAPIGVVSQTDLVLARQGRSGEEARALSASAVMTPGCLACSPTATVSEAITRMTRHRVHRLVVTEAQGAATRLLGIVTMTDLVSKSLGFDE